MSTAEQNNINDKNFEFWNALCGTHLAKKLKITSNSREDLEKYDHWYLKLYKYLYKFIPFKDIANKNVLEIGLGYGTVAQKLMEFGANYHGIDISPGPVSMVQHRSNLLKNSAEIQRCSVLNIPYNSEHFDYIISIGCLHHTGNLVLALNEVLRVLKPGGTAVIMVYNALSYRHWLTDFRATFKRFLKPQNHFTNANETMRGAYDSDLDNNKAPYTTFITKAELKELFKGRVTNLTIQTTNVSNTFLSRLTPRALKVKLFGSLIGLDHYIIFQKNL